MSVGGNEHVSVPRLVLGALGVGLAAYGGFLLLTRQDWSAVADTGVWLAAGVVLHDAVLTPLVLLTWAVLGRWLPPRYRGPAVVGLVVLGSLTLLSLPVLGRFGARPDNPTLLDRPYLAGWLVVAALVAAGVLVAGLVRGRGPGQWSPRLSGLRSGRRSERMATVRKRRRTPRPGGGGHGSGAGR